MPCPIIKEPHLNERKGWMGGERQLKSTSSQRYITFHKVWLRNHISRQNTNDMMTKNKHCHIHRLCNKQYTNTICHHRADRKSTVRQAASQTTVRQQACNYSKEARCFQKQFTRDLSTGYKDKASPQPRNKSTSLFTAAIKDGHRR